LEEVNLKTGTDPVPDA